MKKKKVQQKDKNLLNWLKKGGREGIKKDFIAVLKVAAQPVKALRK